MYNNYLYAYEPMTEFVTNALEAPMQQLSMEERQAWMAAKQSKDDASHLVDSGVEIHNGVAFVPVEGVITKEDHPFNAMFGLTSTDALRRTLDILEVNDEVSSVELQFNSPGGSVNGTHAAYEAVKEFGKPITASTSGLMASAAYYIASGADSIAISDDALVGSIGVMAVLASYKGMFEDMGIDINVVRATGSEKKALQNPYETHTETVIEDERKILDVYRQKFVNAIQSTGRQVSEDALTGEVFVGEDAIRLGLADHTIKEYREMAKAEQVVETGAEMIVEEPEIVAEETETVDPLAGMYVSLGGSNSFYPLEGYSISNDADIEIPSNITLTFDPFDSGVANSWTFVPPEAPEPEVSDEDATELVQEFVSNGIIPSKLLSEKVSIVKRVGLEDSRELLSGLSPIIPESKFVVDSLTPEDEDAKEENVVYVSSHDAKVALEKMYKESGSNKTVKLKNK